MTRREFFTDEELACSHCGEYKFDRENRILLNDIRLACGFALPVTSGYRCPNHPIEVARGRLGEHQEGEAVDIAVYGYQAMRLVVEAYEHGVRRIGVQQTGEFNTRFIHLGFSLTRPKPAFWSY